MSTSYVPKALREKVAAQAKGRCGYCQKQEEVTGSELEIDHILPESLNGPTIEENLWLACSECNTRRNNRVKGIDPETEEIVHFFNPRTQIWFEHFEWSKDGTKLIGKTSTGRATIYALQLNRPLLVKARANWVSVGWHPPKD
jgi:5-methylcytosine-specific restriction endonuclease McrA